MSQQLKAFFITQQALWEQKVKCTHSWWWNICCIKLIQVLQITTEKCWISQSKLYEEMNCQVMKQNGIQNEIILRKYYLNFKDDEDYNINETNQTSLGTGMTSWKHLFTFQPLLDSLQI